MFGKRACTATRLGLLAGRPQGPKARSASQDIVPMGASRDPFRLAAQVLVVHTNADSVADARREFKR